MRALLSGDADVIPTAKAPKAKDANIYRVSPAMEQALKEIRFLIWMAESHDVGVAKIAFRLTECDGSFQDMRQTYGPVRKRAS